MRGTQKVKKEQDTPEKNILDRIDDMEKAMQRVAKEQEIPTLRRPSVDKVLKVLNKR